MTDADPPTASTENASTPTGPIDTSKSAILVGAGILASRLSGIVREVVLSAWLGATTRAAEAFALALTVPKILQNLLGEGALSASFIPVYSQIVDSDPRAARRLAGAVFGLLAALVAVIVLLLMVATRPIVRVIAIGAGDERIDLIAELVRVMAPGIGFIVFAAWCLGILNAHRDFFLSYVAPMLWNVAIIAAVIVWATRTSDEAAIARAAAWGVFAGGVMQFGVQMPRVLRLAGPITPSLDWRSPTAREVLRRFAPGVTGRGVVTLSTFVDVALASFLAVGAVSVLSKAQTLYLMPISVFAISIAAADLPELSREAASPDAAAARVRTAVDRVMLLVTFSALAFVFGGRSLVGALFERGKFGGDDTVAVWLTLAVFSFGLLASALSRVFQTASFARGDVAGPAAIAVARLVVAGVVGLVLMLPADRFEVVGGVVRQNGEFGWRPLAQAIRDAPNAPRLGAVGLAAGGAAAAWFELALLHRRLGGTAVNFGVTSALRRLVVAAVLAGAMIAGLAEALKSLPPLLAAPLVLGPPGVVYLLMAARSGSHTATSLVARLRR